MAHHDDADALARRQARADQEVVVRGRLDRHRVIAARLLEDPQLAKALIAQARTMVARWRTERLCSDDYTDAWSALLDKAPQELAALIVSDAADWDALRQCSPFVAELPRR